MCGGLKNYGLGSSSVSPSTISDALTIWDQLFRTAVFPTAVSPKYSSQSAGKQRMHTCLDQYNANKANGGNANMKWIMKGGGYYSECNKRLKPA